MATLHVHNVPEELYERLRQRAKERNRSLSAEVVTLLEDALEEPRYTQAELLDSIRRRRFFEPRAVYAPDSTTTRRPI